MKVMVTGGRKYSNEEHIRRTFEEFIRTHGSIDELIVGDSTGADSLATVVAYEMGIRVTVHHAEWDKYRLGAGPRRNQKMVDQRPDYCLPFAGGNGTADAIRRCKKAGIPLFELMEE